MHHDIPRSSPPFTASRPGRPTAIGVLLVGLALTGCATRVSPPEEPAPSTPEPSQVIGSEASRRPTPREPHAVPFVGVVIPRETVDVAAETTGRLERVEVRVGDRVEAGDVLARVDTRLLSQDLAMAEASLNALEAEVERRRVELDNAQSRHERRSALPETFSREELSASRLEVETARSALKAAEARLREQQARIEQLREALASSTVRAPFTGTVALRYLDPGAAISPGTPVLRLITPGDLLVRFAVPPAAAEQLALGQPVEVEVQEVNLRARAIIDHIAPEIDTASQMVFMEARFEEDGRLRPGFVARVLPARQGTA